MATRYHVSDHLQDRHHYNVQVGFEEQAAKDKVKLFDGYGQPSFEYNIKALVDEGISVAEKTKTLKHILGHLMNADSKMRAVKYGLVPSLKWLIDQNIGSTVDELACLAFRSLAIIPAGLFSIYRNHGVPCIAIVLAGRLDQPPDNAMLRAREAAGDAIKQLTVGWHAKRILLGDDIPEGMVGLQIEPAGTHEVDAVGSKEDRAQMGRRVVETLTHLITSYNAGNDISFSLLRSALEAISNISSESLGLDLCLICGVLREVDELLRQFSNTPSLWIGNQAPNTAMAGQVVYLAVSVVWNVCMDPIGKRKEEALESLPFSLGKLMIMALQYPMKHLELKAAITGAISAIYIYEDAKSTGVAPLLKSPEEAAIYGVDKDEACDIAALCVRLMHEGNKLLALIGEGKTNQIDSEDTPEVIKEHVMSFIKNAVQSIRLLSELPSARPRLIELINGDKELCLQLFKTTPIEKEMLAAVAASAS
jgi:hypothetical protein|mmetsp:Transcript_1682/g.3062  ORF Transcript_1682/g.3062 Transcript_1682/m.3062 type:complete len:478 (+) Transcript_1682:103-1536(+)|eukprot:CAMPEP_0174282270 /NCGR_PEP_ID=MMETSP0809-20121228/2737_1 /TAXON_ID=73025 ORGANISM="Eutreptiella gymnastica-like, Strain CCMP1594" /NCGR_SAMPLE_ID=MMETSP0809 /ASSEMBLY_ACC=CAM_ASM_000658 /LENGTH=477 /DNA_ID=CAMNT_0015376343 /DNA_START=103 /DNA_END=1536 /DNA_ORIENTATION=+